MLSNGRRNSLLVPLSLLVDQFLIVLPGPFHPPPVSVNIQWTFSEHSMNIRWTSSEHSVNIR
jgi:hypothetical protein